MLFYGHPWSHDCLVVLFIQKLMHPNLGTRIHPKSVRALLHPTTEVRLLLLCEHYPNYIVHIIQTKIVYLNMRKKTSIEFKLNFK
jgi:hypothetical protein